MCLVCGKGFSTSSSLNTHRRIHSGEKPHQCQVCGKRFTASSNLYYHRMTHIKVSPASFFESADKFNKCSVRLNLRFFFLSKLLCVRCGRCRGGVDGLATLLPASVAVIITHRS